MLDLPGIRAWSTSSGTEPGLRVGVLLDADACDNVQLRIGDQRRRLVTSTGVATELDRGVELQVSHRGSALSLQIDDATPLTSPLLRIKPLDTPQAADGGVLVRRLVAGRGFHWEKRVDQVLPATLELTAGEQGIVLVNELGLEEYLAGVITAEMSGACPVEFLKAQCIVARSWLLASSETKHDHDPFDCCNDDCCQRYQGVGELSQAALQAARATRGVVLLDPTDNVLDANYSKSCGGISETPRAVWGIDKPGLAAVVDAPTGAHEHSFLPVTQDTLDEFLDGAWLADARAYCSPNVAPIESIGRYLGHVDEVDNYFRWTVSYTRSALETLLIEKLPEAHDLTELQNIAVTSRGVSGRAIMLRLQWTDSDGQHKTADVESEYRIRQILHAGFLYSSAFGIRLTRDQDGRIDTIVLRGAGWGHGAGLCQIGALGMALSGLDCDTICRHYYPDARLEQVYA